MKRKAEGSPAATSRSKVSRVTMIKSHDDNQDHHDNQDYDHNQGKAKRAVRIAKPVVVNEEDFGRTESQQFLEMVRYGSKKKKDSKKANEYLEAFKKLAKKEHDGLETLLEEKATDITTKNDTFLTAFKSAYTSTMLTLSPTHGQDLPEKPVLMSTELQKTHDRDHRLRKQSELVLSGASELINEYEKCEEILKALREKAIIGKKWKDGIEKAKRVLEGGKLVGEKKVEGIMNGVEETESSQPKDGGALYQKEVEVGAWVHVAKKQEKAVQRMTRLLPE